MPIKKPKIIYINRRKVVCKIDHGLQDLLMGSKGPTDGIEGCNPPQEKARKQANFLVSKKNLKILQKSLKNINKKVSE